MKGIRGAIGAGVLAAALAAPAAAQDVAALGGDLARLDDQAAALRVLLAQSNLNVGAASVIDRRLSDLEIQMQTLTGRVELLENQVRVLNQSLEAMSRDVDFRLSALEGGAPGELNLDVGVDAAAALEAPATTPAAPAASTTNTAPAQVGLPAGTPEQQYQFIRGLLDRGDYRSADANLRRFVELYPTHALASSAFYWLGEIYFDQANYQLAAQTYAAGYQNYPNGYKAPDSLLKLGLALIELGRGGEACATFAQLAASFPSLPINIAQRMASARARAGCA